MNLTKKITLALGVLAAAVAGHSQTATATTTTTPAGVLGQSFSEVSFGLTDIQQFSKHQYGLGVAANVPVTANLDLGAGYSYSWVRRNGHTHVVGGTATYYTTYAGVKPFVSAGVGYEWDRYSNYRNDDPIWGGSAGVEIPFAGFTVTPRVSYADDFRGSRNSSQQWVSGVEANYWVNRTTAVFADVSYVDVKHDAQDAWTYTVGARFKF